MECVQHRLVDQAPTLADEYVSRGLHGREDHNGSIAEHDLVDAAELFAPLVQSVGWVGVELVEVASNLLAIETVSASSARTCMLSHTG